MISRANGPVWLTLISCFLLILVLGACSTSTQVPTSSGTKGSLQPPSAVSSPTLKLGGPECHPPSPLDMSNTGYPEAPGTAIGTTLWVLFEGSIPAVK